MLPIRLTKRTIDALPLTKSGQVLYRDTDLTGFGLRVGTKNKSFFVECSVKKRTVRTTIGRYGPFSPEQARQEAQAKLAAMARGHDPNRAKKEQVAREIRLVDAFAQLLAAKPNLSPVTRSHYQRTIDLYLKALAHVPITQISRQMVLSEHRRISQAHGAVTANSVMRHLRLVYNFVAALHDDLPSNPVKVMSTTRSWAPERRRRTLIASHNLPAWWHAVQNEPSHSRDLLVMALLTGMRRNELTTLRWENVDLPGRALHLPKTKNGDPSSLPLSGALLAMLAARRAATGSVWVFPGTGRTGHITETKSFTRRVEARSGVSFTIHDLRRTFITIAESLDIPAYALKRLLNHRGETDVTGGYIVIDIERLRIPVERIATKVKEMIAQ